MVHPRAAPDARGPSLALAAAAIVLLALNLRIPTAALGPLLPAIQDETGHGETFLSLLTSIPLALTLLVAPFAPRLAHRFGRGRVVGCALIGIVIGTAIRSVPGDGALLSGAAVLGCSIAIGTVLVPALIAAERPRRRGALTGLYTMSLSLGPAIALGLTVPLGDATGRGWRETLVLWAACGVIALAVWVWYARSAARAAGPEPGTAETPASAPEPSTAAPPASARAVPRSPAADPRAWLLAFYLGITSLTFYTTSTWLPTTLVMDGLPAGAAGGYTSMINIVALPFALLAPIVMRRGFARVLAPISPVIAVAGVVVLLVGGAGAALAGALLLGVAQGLCLGVSYAQIVQYARSPGHAASVSAVTSTVGIAIAALGPLVFGFGLEATGSSVIPLAGLGAVILAQAAVGLRSSSSPRP